MLQCTHYTMFCCFLCSHYTMGEFMGYDKVKYNNQYNKENYARLSIQVPKGEREYIDTHWKSKGYKSFNSYVMDLIRKDMNESASSIQVGDISQNGNNNSINIG